MVPMAHAVLSSLPVSSHLCGNRHCEHQQHPLPIPAHPKTAQKSVSRAPTKPRPAAVWPQRLQTRLLSHAQYVSMLADTQTRTQTPLCPVEES